MWPSDKCACVCATGTKFQQMACGVSNHCSSCCPCDYGNSSSLTSSVPSAILQLGASRKWGEAGETTGQCHCVWGEGAGKVTGSLKATPFACMTYVQRCGLKTKLVTGTQVGDFQTCMWPLGMHCVIVLQQAVEPLRIMSKLYMYSGNLMFITGGGSALVEWVSSAHMYLGHNPGIESH